MVDSKATYYKETDGKTLPIIKGYDIDHPNGYRFGGLTARKARKAKRRALHWLHIKQNSRKN